jgi:hypothetical protein
VTKLNNRFYATQSDLECHESAKAHGTYRSPIRDSTSADQGVLGETGGALSHY